MNIPTDLKYTKEHEWIRLEAGVATVGVTDHAQEALSDIVYVELPEVGRDLAKGAEAAAVESTKAAVSVYAPASGTVTETNDALDGDPALVNSDCYGQGWFYKMKVNDESDLADLLDAAAYEQLLAQAQE